MLRRVFNSVLCIVALWALPSCEAASELTQFEITTNSEIIIPATAGVNLPINLVTPDVETNSSTTFNNNDTRADLIEEIYLQTCMLSITSPSSMNFDFLKSVEIFMSTDDLPEILIAERTNIQNGEGTTLLLNATGEDLTDYVKSAHFDLRVRVITDEIPGSEVRIDVESIFFVDAQILGL